MSHTRSCDNHETISDDEDACPLFLALYIESGDRNEALRRSRVALFWDEHKIPNVHSGYITINKTADTNFFLLHIKSEDFSTLCRSVQIAVAASLRKENVVSHFLYKAMLFAAQCSKSTVDPVASRWTWTVILLRRIYREQASSSQR